MGAYPLYVLRQDPVLVLFGLVIVLARVLHPVLLAVRAGDVAFGFSAGEPRVHVGGG